MKDGVETRELRYFVAVAEELHFGRAADRLGIAQPPLSRAIAALERRLGTPLLERTSRGVSMTEAGSVLLVEGRAALDAVDAAERRVRRTALGGPGLVLVAKAGASTELLAKLLAAYAAEPGAVEVELLLCGPAQQAGLLRDGRADVALLHRPFDSTTGVDVEELHTEGQALFLPSGHPLSGRDRLRMSDVEAMSDPPFPRWPDADGTYRDGPGPEVRDTGQLHQLVGLGRVAAVLPESARSSVGGDVAVVPIEDAPLVTTVLAWPPHSRSRALADLVRVAAAR